MVRYSFLVRLFHPLLHAGLSRRILDHFIRLCQHTRWNCETDLFCGFQIDDKFEFLRLFDRQIGGLGVFEDFVDIRSSTSIQFYIADTIGHQATNFRKLRERIYRR
jgi:hypothetical protein